MSNLQLFSIMIPMLFGMICGILFGKYFCQKEYFDINITKKDLEDTLLKTYEQDNPEEVAKARLTQAVNQVEEEVYQQKEDFYRVNISTYIIADTYLDALNKALNSLKGRKNLYFKGGAIDVHNTYVEKVETEEEEDV